MNRKYEVAMSSITVQADSVAHAKELASAIFSEDDMTATSITEYKTVQVNVGFKVVVDVKSNLKRKDFVQAIFDGLPKEFFVDYAEDDWGIEELFPLSNIGGRRVEGHRWIVDHPEEVAR